MSEDKRVEVLADKVEAIIMQSFNSTRELSVQLAQALIDSGVMDEVIHDEVEGWDRQDCEAHNAAVKGWVG